MYSGYGGSPSRTVSTMSLSVSPVRRLTSVSITRSQSFTGVNTYDKCYRNLSVFSTPGLSRRPSRTNRMFTMSTKSNPLPKVPQPERLDQVYMALKNGLQSCLQVHQMDLDSLSRQMKESKRNSRLGFLYEVDKQVKVTERYIRRLEFHLSKLEELYESYCIQRRLRVGADKMVKAYTVSQGSREARESLVEANKGFKEYTENMCVLESEFETQMGEFHIKMRGLAGFARLCAGDQYEIFMKYGRQRWKLRGRIEINSKQVWDSEEIVFVPLINEFLSVKVTELKSLANHVTVGNVSCETKDLFAALPQTVAVDINDLGTIKLNLEITWNPFDKEDQGSISSTVKAPSVSKRFSTILNQTPPDTPSLREQVFYNMLRQREESENGTAWSHSSESSDDSSSPVLSASELHSGSHHHRHTDVGVSAEMTPAATLANSSSNSDSSFSSVSHVSNMAKHQASGDRDEQPGPVSVRPPQGAAGSSSHAACHYSRSLSHISESSADGVVVVTDRSAPPPPPPPSPPPQDLISAGSTSDMHKDMRSRTQEPRSCAATHTHSAEAERKATAADVTQRHLMDSNTTSDNTHLECEPIADSRDVPHAAGRVQVKEVWGGGGAGGGPRTADVLEDGGLKGALEGVVSSLDDYRGQFPELQLLEQELKLLRVTLKGGDHSRSPSVFSLTVETALGSFDFLNTSEWAEEEEEKEEEEEEKEEEEEEEEEKRGKRSRCLQERGWDPPSPPTTPLTTGCAVLDSVLIVHLKICTAQLLCLGTFGPLRCREMYALDKLLREARVLQLVRWIMKEPPALGRQQAEVIPQLGLCPGAALLWEQCVGRGSVYMVSAHTFMLTLSTVYARLMHGRADTVCLCLVERVLDQSLPRRGSTRSDATVTVFQLWSYLESNGISDMETHVTELAEEVRLVHSLASRDQDVVLHGLRYPRQGPLTRDALQAVAKLLKDSRSKVSASATSLLRSLAAQARLREQAVVSCMELLEDNHVDVRVCGCKALACLKAKESIDQLVYLCQTDKEEVRDAAKQTLLLLGEEGMMAHRHVETSHEGLPRLFAPGSLASTAF